MDYDILHFINNKQTMALLAVCSGPSLVRDKPLGTPAFVRLAYSANNSKQLPPKLQYYQGGSCYLLNHIDGLC